MAEGDHEDDWTLCAGDHYENDWALCAGDHYEHDWTGIPRGGSGDCPRCGTELVDEEMGEGQ